ncbi:MAG: fibronectin type III domain-containing protein [Peptococcaceae bacterium]|nr:fibronectin type III domain-containing protein [Peptococcaceae bacterium]
MRRFKFILVLIVAAGIVSSGFSFKAEAAVELVEVGSYSGLTNAVDVTVNDSVAYVVYNDPAGQATLAVIDVSQPDALVVKGRAAAAGSSVALDVYGNYVFIAMAGGNPGLQKVSVADQQNPLPGTHKDLSEAPRDLKIANGLAYVPVGDKLYIMDHLAGPEFPQIVGTYYGAAETVDVEGDWAFIGREGGLKPVNVGDLPNITEGGAYGGCNQVRDVYVTGNYAYLAAGSDGLHIVDVSNPGRISLPKIAALNSFEQDIESVFVVSNMAYLAGTGGNLYVVNVNNPASPQLIMSCDTGNAIAGLYVKDDYIYLASGDKLKIYTLNYAPNTPDNLSPSNNASVETTTPVLSAGFSDPDEGDYLSAAEWQIATGLAFTAEEIVYSATNNAAFFTVPAEAKLAYGTTYYWRVRFSDRYGSWSGWSETFSFTPVDLPPAAPTGLAAAAGDAQVDLTWNGVSAQDLAGYNVYRAAASEGPYEKANESLIAQGTSFTVTGLTNGTTYYFRVTAVDNNGNESASSETVTATPQDLTPPAVPTNLTAEAHDKEVVLRWPAVGDEDLAGYNVFRSEQPGGPFQKVNESIINGCSYTVSELANGTTYYFAVTAVDVRGNESGRCEAVAAAPVDDRAPGAPQGLTVSPGVYKVFLEWVTNTEPDLAGYYIYLSTDGISFAQSNPEPVAGTSYTVTGLAHRCYYFYIKAVDQAGNYSPASQVVEAIPQNRRHHSDPHTPSQSEEEQQEQDVKDKEGALDEQLLITLPERAGAPLVQVGYMPSGEGFGMCFGLPDESGSRLALTCPVFSWQLFNFHLLDWWG